MTLGGSSGSWAGAASATRSNVQYNPAGDTRQRVRTSSLEIGFLGNVKKVNQKYSNVGIFSNGWPYYPILMFYDLLTLNIPIL